MTGSFHLAWRYVSHHRVRTFLLALALGLTLALPLVLKNFVEISKSELQARAKSTPLILGAKGSALDVTLNALYFRQSSIERVTMKRLENVQSTGFAQGIPLYVRYRTEGAPIVGTSLEYFTFRRLQIAEGKNMTRLGDCILGAKVARRLGLKPGGSLISSSEQVFDISGVYPLKMRITGVLAETHTADDEAVFVDIKTTWLIEGIAHGHDEFEDEPEEHVIEKSHENVALTNAVRLFTEVTEANVDSFHFHGRSEAFPLSSVLVLPHDAKSQALLLGRYQGVSDVQLISPSEQMNSLLAVLFQAQKFALVAFLSLGVLVILIAALVFALSFKLRRKEFAALEDLGVSRWTLISVKTFEIVIVGTFALLIVLLAKWGVETFGSSLVRFGMS